jgi:hypothetical protein
MIRIGTAGPGDDRGKIPVGLDPVAAQADNFQPLSDKDRTAPDGFQ